ncbi:MAG: hypothetical protein CSA96_04315 [Bacteroidetes bacterium]|nr:MAG: hypothetical protein CSA96_04315 [Bacteroidota bacterium]
MDEQELRRHQAENDQAPVPRDEKGRNERIARDLLKKGKGAPGPAKGVSSFVKYSGMGFQMLATILVFYWAGSKLDQRSGNEKPLYTGILTMLGVCAGLYLVLKDFIFRKDG